MFMLMFLCYAVMAAIITSTDAVQCLPVRRMDNSSLSVLDCVQTDQPVILSKELHMQLRSKELNSSGLVSLSLNAKALTEPNILKAKVRSIDAHYPHMHIYAHVYM